MGQKQSCPGYPLWDGLEISVPEKLCPQTTKSARLPSQGHADTLHSTVPPEPGHSPPHPAPWPALRNLPSTTGLFMLANKGLSAPHFPTVI